MKRHQATAPASDEAVGGGPAQRVRARIPVPDCESFPSEVDLTVRDHAGVAVLRTKLTVATPPIRGEDGAQVPAADEEDDRDRSPSLRVAGSAPPSGRTEPDEEADDPPRDAQAVAKIGFRTLRIESPLKTPLRVVAYGKAGWVSRDCRLAEDASGNVGCAPHAGGDLRVLVR